MVRPGARKKLIIRARFDRPVAEPPPITYHSLDPGVLELRTRTALELVLGTTCYEGSVVVEGRKLNSRTKVVAALGDRTTSCIVSVAAREED